LSILLLLACHFILPHHGATQSIASGDALEGIWEGETRYGPVLKGELKVSRNGTTWHATIGKVSTTFQISKNQIRFAFPAALGSCRG
jgi:hypothetical protein